ncbi:MAG: FtsQ-type POTRA domain-containing protein [Treponema sp.]|jgi:cell division protein FtsQ|nr:FtsQ-type POTRA domain-containing protein [Treponema sp.]
MPDEFIYSSQVPLARKTADSTGLRRRAPAEDLFPERGSGGEGEKAKDREGGKLEKGVKAIIIAAAAVLLLELVWLLAISPCMPLSRIEVTSFPGLDRAEVLLRGGIGERSSFISVDRRELEKNLERIKEVESARVTKQFPGTVKILLVPRVAVAVAFAAPEGRQVPVYFDRHGVAFKVGGVPYGAQSLPVLSGLPLEADKPLSPLYLPLFASLDRIRYADAELLGAISEIKINKKPFDGYDLVLYPVHSPIRVRLESTLNEETLRYVMLMLDVFAQENQEIDEIDFRTGTASYRLKEVPSGQ